MCKVGERSIGLVGRFLGVRRQRIGILGTALIRLTIITASKFRDQPYYSPTDLLQIILKRFYATVDIEDHGS